MFWPTAAGPAGGEWLSPEGWRHIRQRRYPGEDYEFGNVVWYKIQHKHWWGWPSGCRGPGTNGRQDWDKSAEFVYNHVVNPQMLVYRAEAAVVSELLVEAAASAALANNSTMMSMSASVRRTVPWEMVERALRAR